MDLGLALGGAIFTESIFNLPGLGREVIQAYNRADLPLITGIVVFSTDCRDRVQFPRGRHLRLPRPADPAELMAAALEVKDLSTSFRTDDGIVQAVSGVSFELGQGEDAGRRRRVRLGQERHVPHRHGARRSAAGDRQRLGAAPGRGDARREPVADAADPRPHDRDDLPGPDDVAEPGEDDRVAAPGGGPDPSGRLEEGRADARRSRSSRRSRSRAPTSASTTTRISSRAACASA